MHVRHANGVRESHPGLILNRFVKIVWLAVRSASNDKLMQMRIERCPCGLVYHTNAVQREMESWRSPLVSIPPDHRPTVAAYGSVEFASRGAILGK